MKKIKNLIGRRLPCILSFFGALIGVYLGHFIGEAAAGGSVVGAILGNGIFFLMVFAGGYAGMMLGIRLMKITLELPKKRTAALAASAILIFAAGCAGQTLFMLDEEDYMVRTDGDIVDVVLLLDGSSSMDSLGYQDARNAAAAEFIESLDEDTKLQVIGYHGGIISAYTSDLLDMTDENKETLIGLVSNMDSVGTTSYDAALSAALETLTGSDAREDSVKAVILLTDGLSGDLDSSTVDAFEASGAILFTVQIAGSGSDTQIQDLADLAEGSGGFYLTLTPDASGDLSSGELSDAFADAFEQASYESGSETVLKGNRIMLYQGSVSAWQFLVRLLTVMICMMLSGLFYYGTTGKRALLANAGAGLLLSVMITVTSLFGGLVHQLIIALLLGTAFVSMEITEIPEDDGETGSGDGPGREMGSIQEDVSEDPLPEEDIFYV